MTASSLPEPDGYPYMDGHAPGRGRALCMFCGHGWPCPEARERGITKAVVLAEILRTVRGVDAPPPDPEATET